MLKRLSFDVEVLTPAFVGGHEPRKLDEHTPLRPHTIRGLLRWWFRAAAGSVLWPTDQSERARRRMIVELRKVESALFGDTEHASNVMVLPPKVSRAQCQPFEIPDSRRSPGQRYLGYGLFEDGRRPEAIYPHHTPIPVTLRLRREITGAPDLLGATVWLWTALGGIGARSRRGYGSLRLVKADDAMRIKGHLIDQPSTHTDLVKQLHDGIAWATNVFLEYLPKFTTHPLQRAPGGPHPELRTLYGIDGDDSIVALAGMFGAASEAMERMGRLFQSFRSTLERHRLGMPPLADYFAVKNSITSRRPPSSLDRAAFGLPLPFYFRSLQGAKATFLPQHADRLASPLLLRIHALKISTGQRYVGTLINLVGRGDSYVHPLLARRLVERKDKDKESGSFAPPNGAILRQFIQWAKTEASNEQARKLRGQR
ncbi:MAG: type III-B CRISPR module RAMP protein Cmr1 [Kofleriaceae bacterium]